MPANRVSFLAKNSRTGSHLLCLYSGTDMSIKASFPGQVRFIVKNRISHNRVLGASKGNNQGAYGPSCVPPWSRQRTELETEGKNFITVLNILSCHRKNFETTLGHYA